MRDDEARTEILSLKLYRELHDGQIAEKAYRGDVERLEAKVEALQKAFNDVMELVVAKTHLVNFSQWDGPHTLDVERSAVEMMQT